MALQETALRVALESDNAYVESIARSNIGGVHTARGEFEAADTQLRAALELTIRGGFMFPRTEALVHLCDLTLAREGAEEALPRYRETLDFAREAHHPREEAAALVGLARCEVETGDRTSGIAHAQEALDLYERMRNATQAAKLREFIAAAAA